MKISFNFNKKEIKEGTPEKSGYYAVLFHGEDNWSVLSYSDKHKLWNSHNVLSVKEAKKYAISKISKKYLYLSSDSLSFNKLMEKAAKLDAELAAKGDEE